MRFPKLKDCLCGLLSLRTGTLIIGYYTLIECLFALYASVSFNVYFAETPREEIINKLFNSSTEHFTDEQIDKVLTILYAVIYITLIVAIISVSAALFLILGVYKKNHKFMLPWVIWTGKTLCFVFLFDLIVLITLPWVNLSHIVGDNWMAEVYLKIGYATFLAITTVIPSYCFLVTFSHYRQIKYENRQLSNQFESLNGKGMY